MIFRFFYGIFILMSTAFSPIWTAIICSELNISCNMWLTMCIISSLIGMFLLCWPIKWIINAIK